MISFPVHAQPLSNLHSLFNSFSMNYEVFIQALFPPDVIMLILTVCFFFVWCFFLQASRGTAYLCVCEEKTSDTQRVQERRIRCCVNFEWRVRDCQ